jgi:replicative DNA helicase
MADDQGDSPKRGRRKSGPTNPDERAFRGSLADHLPPQNLHAERAVLGAILRDNQVLPDVVRVTGEDQFYSAAHQKIFKLMSRMYEAGQPIDLVTLGEELDREGWLLEIGGGPYLITLFEETLTAANVSHFAKIVHERYITRSVIHSCNEILRDAYDSANRPDDLLANAERKIFGIMENRIREEATDLKQVLDKVFDRIAERQSRTGSLALGVPTPFIDLSNYLLGWQPGEFIILAARPSVGKTAFALNLVHDAAVTHSLPVLFVSLEMSQLEIAERILCLNARVNNHLLRKGMLQEEDMNKLIGATGLLSTAPLFIDDTPGLTLTQIAATARRLKRRKGLAMIVIDYLQLIEPEDKSVARVEQIGSISRRVKILAKDLQVPVMALSQLNRGVESREGHRPRMSDLRESGSLEQDADVVLLLHRDDAYDPNERPNEADIIIAKQRNGPVGEVKLTFRKEYTRFEDYHPEVASFGEPADGF